jgi:cytidylate kinase
MYFRQTRKIVSKQYITSTGQQFASYLSYFFSDTGVTYRAVSLALPRAFNREIQKKERARRQEGKRARGQEGKKAKGEEKM